MKCPRCGNILKEVDHEGVILETCEQCGGEWLDHGEMLHVIHTEEKEFTEEDVSKVKGVNSAVPTELKQPEKPLICPRCENPLHALNYNYSTGIIIDKCHSCHGVWLDKEELEHVQIVIEERKKQLPEIEKKFAPILAKITEETHKRRKEHIQNVVKSSSGPFGVKHPAIDTVVHGILWHLFD